MNRIPYPLRAIIFDFGGVLMDWNPRYLYRKMFQGDEDAMERFFREIDFEEWNLEQDRGRPFHVAVAEWSARFPHYTDYIKAYDERWEEMLPGSIPQNVEILGELKRAGHSLHGLSNWSAEKFNSVRDRYPFFGWFDSIMLSSDVKLVKPDARIYTLMLQRMGLAASECVFIDDSASNIETARTLGFIALRYRSSDQLRRDLHQLQLLPPPRVATAG